MSELITRAEELIPRLQAGARYEHDDLSLLGDAADLLMGLCAEIERLKQRIGEARLVIDGGEYLLDAAVAALKYYRHGPSIVYLEKWAAQIRAFLATLPQEPGQ